MGWGARCLWVAAMLVAAMVGCGEGLILRDESGSSYVRSERTEFIYTQFSAVPPAYPGVDLDLKQAPSNVCTASLGSTVDGLAVLVHTLDGVCYVDEATRRLQDAGAKAVLFTREAIWWLDSDELEFGLPGSDEFAPFTIPSMVLVNGTYLKNQVSDGVSTVPITLFQQALVAEEREALVELFWASAGEDWFFHDSVNGRRWNPDNENSDPCRNNWERVICRPASQDGTPVGASVQQLLLEQMNMNGYLPDILSELKGITVFDVSDNKLGGELPSAISTWEDLDYLRVARNSFTGSGLPPGFGTFSFLYAMDLSNNLFSGDLNTWQFPPSAQIILMEGNKLTGDLEFGVPVGELEQLSLSNNLLTGELTPAFLSSVSSLGWLELSGNHLTGAVPSAINSLTELRVLGLGQNSFTEIPLLTLANLELLDVQGNELTDLPDLSGLTSLLLLDASLNSLGDVPTLPSQLEVLSIGGNDLTDFGSSLAGVQLELLDASSNPRITDLAAIATQLPASVSVVNLENCALEHAYPMLEMALFARLSALTELDLSGNQLETQLKITETDAYALTKLRRLDVSDNLLYGAVSDVFEDLASLRHFDFSSNNLTRLSGSGSLVPSFAVPDYDAVSTTAMPNAACPTFFNPTSKLTVVMDASYHQYLLCNCLDGYYNTTVSCEKCLDNAFCEGYPTLQTTNTIVANKGYFPLSKTTEVSNLFAIATNRADNATFGERSVHPRKQNVSFAETETIRVVTIPETMLACEFNGMRVDSDANPCNPTGNTANFSCATGHRDRMCSRCDDGYFQRNGECVRCVGDSVIYPVVIVVSLIVFVVGSAAVAITRDTVPIVHRVSHPISHVLCSSYAAGKVRHRRLGGESKAWDPNARKAATAAAASDSQSYAAETESTGDGDTYETETGDTYDDTDDTYDDDEYYEEQEQGTAYPDEEDTYGVAAEAAAVTKAGLGDDAAENLRHRRRHALKEYLQAVLAVVINFSQTLSIVVQDLSLPTSVLPAVSLANFSSSDTTGIGLECVDTFSSFRSQYQLMMVLPLCLFALVVMVFAIKFVFRFRKAADLQRRLAAEDEQDLSYSYDYDYGYESCTEPYSEENEATPNSPLVDSADSSTLASLSSSASSPTTTSSSPSSSPSSSSSSSSPSTSSAEESEQNETVMTVTTAVAEAVAERRAARALHYHLSHHRALADPAPMSPVVIFVQQLVYFAFLILNFAYFPMAAFVLNVYQCDDDPVSGVSYMRHIPYLRCSYLSNVEKAIPLVVYVVTPSVCLLVAMLAIERRPQSFFLNTSFGFWFGAFTGKHRYFSILFLFRRLGLSAVVALVSVDQVWRHLMVIAVLLISAMAVYELHPFYHGRVNRIEVLSQLVLVMIVIDGILSETLTSSDQETTIAVAFLLCVAIFACYCLVSIALPIYRVFVVGEWHDQPSRDKQMFRAKLLYKLAEKGVPPHQAKRLI